MDVYVVDKIENFEKFFGEEHPNPEWLYAYDENKELYSRVGTRYDKYEDLYLWKVPSELVDLYIDAKKKYTKGKAFNIIKLTDKDIDVSRFE